MQKPKWAVVDIRTSRGIKSERRIVGKYATLIECETHILDAKAGNSSAYPTELAIREVK